MTAPAKPAKPWLSGFCNPTNPLNTHRPCRGGYTRMALTDTSATGTWTPCTCQVPGCHNIDACGCARDQDHRVDCPARAQVEIPELGTPPEETRTVPGPVDPDLLGHLARAVDTVGNDPARTWAEIVNRASLETVQGKILAALPPSETRKSISAIAKHLAEGRVHVPPPPDVEFTSTTGAYRDGWTDAMNYVIRAFMHGIPEETR